MQVGAIALVQTLDASLAGMAIIQKNYAPHFDGNPTKRSGRPTRCATSARRTTNEGRETVAVAQVQ